MHVTDLRQTDIAAKFGSIPKFKTPLRTHRLRQRMSSAGKTREKPPEKGAADVFDHDYEDEAALKAFADCLANDPSDAISAVP